jgi:putative membrane protein
MPTAAKVLVGIVAALHVWFLVLEMFLWKTDVGVKVFKKPKEFLIESAPLAMNQGLYNGFLAAGLVWSFFIDDPAFAFQTRVFFLGCVVVAGVFGAATASASILVIQALPGAIALGLVYAAR